MLPDSQQEPQKSLDCEDPRQLYLDLQFDQPADQANYRYFSQRRRRIAQMKLGVRYLPGNPLIR
jgi:hypothetical protein